MRPISRRLTLLLCLLGVLASLRMASAEDGAVPPSAPVLDPSLRQYSDPSAGSPIPEESAPPAASDETADGAPVPDPYALPSEQPAPESSPETTETAETPPAEPAPEPEAVAEADASARTEAKLDDVGDDHPAFQRLRPNWAVQVYGAYSALGTEPVVTGRPGSFASAVMIDFDYQPAILQAIGVLGVGVSGGIFPVTDAGDAVAEPWSIYQIGAHAKYQARFFREQILVPFVGFNFERLSYSIKSQATGLQQKDHLNRQFATFGAMLLLNTLEPSAAHEAYRDWRILRSYLTFEIRPMNVASGPLALSGNSYYFGVRVEY